MSKHSITIIMLLLLIIVMIFTLPNKPTEHKQPNIVVVDAPPIFRDYYKENNLGPFIHPNPYKFKFKQPYRTDYYDHPRYKENRRKTSYMFNLNNNNSNNNNNNNNNNNDDNTNSNVSSISPISKPIKKPIKEKTIKEKPIETLTNPNPNPISSWQTDLSVSQNRISKLFPY